MKIAIPTEGTNGLEEIVAQHFGRCPTYTILDHNGNCISTIKNISSHYGGEKLPPDLMKDFNIDVLLCKNIGYKALQLFQELNIEVFITNEKTVKECFNQWKKGSLKPAKTINACKEHDQCK